MMQKYVIAFRGDLKALTILGDLKTLIPEAKITKLSLNCAEVECPVYEEQSLHYMFENAHCTVSRSRTYGLADALAATAQSEGES